MKPYLILAVLAVFLLLAGCKGEKAPEVSGEPKEITSFRFTHRGSDTSQCFVYAMEASSEGVRFYTEGLYSGGPVVDCTVEALALSQLEVLARNHRLDRWDGFSKKASNVSDGTDFALSILYADGSAVSAEGSNRFPDGFAETKEAICELFAYWMERCAEEAPIDGGNTTRVDPEAPKTIVSKEITALSTSFFCLDADDPAQGAHYAFRLTPDGDGKWTLSVSAPTEGSVTVDESVLREVQTLIDDYALAGSNGLYSVTAGLPVEYTPCFLSVDYASEEHLEFTVDGDPEAGWCAALRTYFLNILSAEGADVP